MGAFWSCQLIISGVAFIVTEALVHKHDYRMAGRKLVETKVFEACQSSSYVFCNVSCRGMLLKESRLSIPA